MKSQHAQVTWPAAPFIWLLPGLQSTILLLLHFLLRVGVAAWRACGRPRQWGGRTADERAAAARAPSANASSDAEAATAPAAAAQADDADEAQCAIVVRDSRLILARGEDKGSSSRLLPIGDDGAPSSSSGATGNGASAHCAGDAQATPTPSQRAGNGIDAAVSGTDAVMVGVLPTTSFCRLCQCQGLETPSCGALCIAPCAKLGASCSKGQGACATSRR